MVYLLMPATVDVITQYFHVCFLMFHSTFSSGLCFFSIQQSTIQ